MPWYWPAGLFLVCAAVLLAFELTVRRSPRWQRWREQRMRRADERRLMDYYQNGSKQPEDFRRERGTRIDRQLPP